MRHPVLMAAFAAALTAFSLSVSATESIAGREREQTDKPLRIEPPSVVEAPVPATAPGVALASPGETLQAARKPDETPFSKIKILPSF